MLVLAVEMVVWQQDEFGPFSPADHQTMDHKDFRFSKPWLYLEKKKNSGYVSYKESHCPTPHCFSICFRVRKVNASFCCALSTTSLSKEVSSVG